MYYARVEGLEKIAASHESVKKDLPYLLPEN